MKHVRDFSVPRERVPAEVSRAFQSIQVSLRSLDTVIQTLSDDIDEMRALLNDFEEIVNGTQTSEKE